MEVSETILSDDQWFSFYLNPLNLINVDESLDYDDCEPKTIQKLKKALLREIDLEDGVVPWVENLVIDKSKAIGLCDELNDDQIRWWHWNVFSYKPLLNFLHHGSYEHFFVDKNESPLEIIELIEQDEDFCEWISIPFSKQYDLVLSSTLDALSKSPVDKELDILKCLLDGRRWVSLTHEDRCFENSRKIINNLLNPLRNIAASSEKKAPKLQELISLIDESNIAHILNILPVYFNDYRNEAVSLIRDISINCFNLKSDHKLSKSILDLTNLFDYKSILLDEKVKEDFHTLEEIRLDKLLTPLINALNDAEKSVPELKHIESIIVNGNIASSINGLSDDFADIRSRAVSIIRDISICCFNVHGNSDLSRSILQLTELFLHKTSSLNEKIKDDFKTIDSIIKEERKFEAKKSSGSDAWEITKEGVKQGSRFIPSPDVTAIRWGSIITKRSYGVEYDFLLSVKTDDGRSIVCNWKTSKDVEVSRGHFDDLINATLNYICPVVITRIEERLRHGGSVRIGGCRVNGNGIEFETSGWLGKSTHSVPWRRVVTSIENGELVLKDITSNKAKITMPLIETDNAVILKFLADQKSQ